MKTKKQHIANIKKRFNAYVNGVESGKVVTGNLVKLAIKRFHDDLINNTDYYFDLDEAVKMIYAIEANFCFSKGEWYGKPIKMEPWQVFTEAQKYGWFADKDRYRFLRIYEEVAKKNGKSPRKAWGALAHIISSHPGSAVFVGATKIDQARIITDYVGKTIIASPKLRDSDFNLYYFRDEISRVVYRPKLSSVRTLTSQAEKDQGTIPTLGIIDEYWAHKDDAVYTGLKRGLINSRNPILDTITTAGDNKEGPCYQMRSMAIDVLENKIEDDRFMIMIHSLDKDDDWKDESVWPKANPNYGISVQVDGFRDGFKEAVNLGGNKEFSFKTLNLNQWMDAVTVWIPSDKWSLCNRNPISIEGRKAFGAIQLAATISTNCFTLCLPNDDGSFDFKCWFWMPRQSAIDDKEMKDNFLRWADEGWLTLTPGNVIDYDIIIKHILDIQARCNLLLVNFAPNYESAMMPLLDQGIDMAKCANTWTNMTAPIRHFEKMVSERSLNHEGNKVLAWQLSHVAVRSGGDDSVRLDKEASQGKIDGPVSMIMSIKAMLESKEPANTGNADVW